MKEDIEFMKKELDEVKEQSWAMSVLKDYKTQNKRMFIILIIVLIMWFLTIGYLVYTLNDIGTTTTTQEVQQENESGNNNFVGGNGDITNGKTNDKTNSN